MSEMHFRQPRFRYWACGPSTKNKERVHKFTNIFYQNEQDKACFQHDLAYGGFKYLNGRTAADKVLHDKALNITKNLKYDGCPCFSGL